MVVFLWWWCSKVVVFYCSLGWRFSLGLYDVFEMSWNHIHCYIVIVCSKTCLCIIAALVAVAVLAPSWESWIVCAFCDCYPPNENTRCNGSAIISWKTTRMTASTRQLLGEGDELLPSYVYGDCNKSLYIQGSLFKKNNNVDMALVNPPPPDFFFFLGPVFLGTQ